MLLTEILKRSSVVCYYFVTVKPGALVVSWGGILRSIDDITGIGNIT